MTSKSLVVFYEPGSQGSSAAPTGAGGPSPSPLLKSATPGPGGNSSIKRLEARGHVIVTRKDQIVSGETAVFDTAANLITVRGGVILTQCKNVLRGDRLLVNMTTGVSRVESDSGPVKGMFNQSSGPSCDAPATSPAPPIPGSRK